MVFLGNSLFKVVECVYQLSRFIKTGLDISKEGKAGGDQNPRY